mgnify:CR=1 FL=1
MYNNYNRNNLYILNYFNMSNMYDITEITENFKVYYYNPITKRNILKNNRNLISIQKQIKAHLLKNPPTPTAPAAPADPVAPAAPDDDMEDNIKIEINELFNMYSINKTALNNYVNRLVYVAITARGIRYEIINNIDTANQSLFNDRLKFMDNEICSARTSLLKFIKKYNISRKHYNIIIENFNKYEDIFKRISEQVRTLKKYETPEAEAEAIKKQNEHGHAINMMNMKNDVIKKINKLFDKQLAEWLRDTMNTEGESCKYGRTLKIKKNNIKIDYDLIKSKLYGDYEHEIFNKHFGHLLTKR